MCAQSLNHVHLFATPWTVACQAPLSMWCSSKNSGVGCHFLVQGIFPTQGLNLCLHRPRLLSGSSSHQMSSVQLKCSPEHHTCERGNFRAETVEDRLKSSMHRYPYDRGCVHHRSLCSGCEWPLESPWLWGVLRDLFLAMRHRHHPPVSQPLGEGIRPLFLRWAPSLQPR